MIPSSDIKRELKTGGIARKNRFHVEFTIPDKVLSALQERGIRADERMMSLRCYSSQLPPKAIATTDSKFGGKTIKVPYGMNFDDVVTSFIADRRMDLKRVFDVWQEVISPNSSSHVSYLDDITSNITVHHLSERDEVLYSQKLKKAFPILVNAVDYAGDDNDSYQIIGVTWTFKTVENDNEVSSQLDLPDFLETAVQSIEGLNISYALEFLDDLASFSLQGEAQKWYQKTNDFIRQFTGGYGINSMASLVKRMEYAVEKNTRFVTEDRLNIQSALSNFRDKLGI